MHLTQKMETNVLVTATSPWPKVVDGLYEDITMPPPLYSAPEVFENQPAYLKILLIANATSGDGTLRKNIKPIYEPTTG